jgi:hypothetical protein
MNGVGRPKSLIHRNGADGTSVQQQCIPVARSWATTKHVGHTISERLTAVLNLSLSIDHAMLCPPHR